VVRKDAVISAVSRQGSRARQLEQFLAAKIDAEHPYARLQRDVRKILIATVPLRSAGAIDRRPIETLDRHLEMSAPGARATARAEYLRRIEAGRALNRLSQLLEEIHLYLDFERVAPTPELRRRSIPVVPLRPVLRIGSPDDPSADNSWTELILGVFERVLGGGQVFLARCGHLVVRQVTRGRRPVTCGAEDCVRAARREPTVKTTARAATARRRARRKVPARRP
jgi:hypothetical protein